jgi:hypothetical protein
VTQQMTRRQVGCTRHGEVMFRYQSRETHAELRAPITSNEIEVTSASSCHGERRLIGSGVDGATLVVLIGAAAQISARHEGPLSGYSPSCNRSLS